MINDYAALMHTDNILVPDLVFSTTALGGKKNKKSNFSCCQLIVEKIESFRRQLGEIRLLKWRG